MDYFLHSVLFFKNIFENGKGFSRIIRSDDLKSKKLCVHFDLLETDKFDFEVGTDFTRFIVNFPFILR